MIRLAHVRTCAAALQHLQENPIMGCNPITKKGHRELTGIHANPLAPFLHLQCSCNALSNSDARTKLIIVIINIQRSAPQSGMPSRLRPQPLRQRRVYSPDQPQYPIAAQHHINNRSCTRNSKCRYSSKILLPLAFCRAGQST